MASPKALQFEKDLLESVASVKQVILTHVHDSEAKQQCLIHVNNLFDRGHKEARNLRKSLAFLHSKLEVLEEWVRNHEGDPQSIYDTTKMIEM